MQPVTNFCKEPFFCWEYSQHQISFAIFSNGKCVDFVQHIVGGQGAEQWQEILTEFCPQKDWKKMKAIGLSIGPGSFTALRVSFATISAISQVFQLPVFGVDSLKVMFFSVLQDDAFVSDLCTDYQRFVPMIKAYQGETYFAVYAVSKQNLAAAKQNPLFPLQPVEVILPRTAVCEQMFRYVQNDDLVWGTGIEQTNLAEILSLSTKNAMMALPIYPNAQGVGRYLVARGSLNRPSHLLEPLYLMAPYAQRQLARKIYES